MRTRYLIRRTILLLWPATLLLAACMWAVSAPAIPAPSSLKSDFRVHDSSMIK